MDIAHSAPFFVLTLALISLWLPWRQSHLLINFLWLILFSLALLLAVLFGIVEPVALLPIVVFFLLLIVYGASTGVPQLVLAIVILLLAFLFGAHLLPGFNNLLVIDNAVLSDGARPYSLYLNFDKALLGLFMLALLHPLITARHEWLVMLQASVPAVLVTLVAVIGLSLLSGYTAVEPKLPSFFLTWFWVNLFFTCMAEEVFFRGFIQRQLARQLQAYANGAVAAWLAGALLFGLAHIAGGLHYVVLATVAGLGYGWVYHKTQRIEACILLHLLLNTIHILFFTYPAVRI